MIIRREAINATLAASDKDDTGYNLKGVFVEPDGRVVATNGHILLIAKDKEPMKDEDFPVIAGLDPFHGNPEKGVLIDADMARSIIAATPKKSTIPILSCVQLAKNGTGTTLAATDLQAPRVAHIEENEDRSFPSYERVLPKADRPVFKVCLSIPVLEVMLKAAKAVKGRKGDLSMGITLSIPSDEKAYTDGALTQAIGLDIAGDDVDITGCAMPMRL